MKSRTFKYSLTVVMATLFFFACNAMAANEPVSALSGDATLNTVTFTSAADALAKDADTRTYTEDLSDAGRLDTRPLISSMILIR